MAESQAPGTSGVIKQLKEKFPAIFEVLGEEYFKNLFYAIENSPMEEALKEKSYNKIFNHLERNDLCSSNTTLRNVCLRALFALEPLGDQRAISLLHSFENSLKILKDNTTIPPKLIKKLKHGQHFYAGMAEAYVSAKLSLIHSAEIKFDVPSGHGNKNFDIQAQLDGQTINIEVTTREDDFFSRATYEAKFVVRPAFKFNNLKDRYCDLALLFEQMDNQPITISFPFSTTLPIYSTIPTAEPVFITKLQIRSLVDPHVSDEPPINIPRWAEYQEIPESTRLRQRLEDEATQLPETGVNIIALFYISHFPKWEFDTALFGQSSKPPYSNYGLFAQENFRKIGGVISFNFDDCAKIYVNQQARKTLTPEILAKLQEAFGEVEIVNTNLESPRPINPAQHLPPFVA